MVANYKGMDSEFRYRIAELNWDEDKEEEKANLVIDIMEKDYGWSHWSLFGGYACIEVEDLNEYRYFMKDLKKAKKQASEYFKSKKGDMKK